MRLFAFLGIFIALFFMPLISAVDVDIYSEVHSDRTYFIYDFIFDQNESFDTFSFEKPRDSKIISVFDSQDNFVRYTETADFFILRPINATSNTTFHIVFESSQTSSNVLEKKSFSSYVNIDIDVDRLEYVLSLEDEYGEIEEIFPRDYIQSGVSEITWEIYDVKDEVLFLVNFEGSVQSKLSDNFHNLILVLLALPLFLFFLLFFLVKMFSKGTKKHENLEEENDGYFEEEVKGDKEEDIKGFEEKINEYMIKYLTENESDVVKIVLNNEGISQNDILHHLPQLSKSNLSKIIYKLDYKRVLNRIKVGKINKIYFGEVLKDLQKNKTEDETKENP